MTTTEATSAVAAALAGIAPEVRLDDLDREAALRDEADLDSLDFLSLVESLQERTGVSIPETDYGRVRSVNDLVGYLVAHAA